MNVVRTELALHNSLAMFTVLFSGVGDSGPD